MSTAYPTLNFGLGEEIDMLRDAVYQMCAVELAPRATQIDKDNEFPMDMWRKFGDMGLLGITVEEEYGGSGMGYVAHSVAMEEISRASASVVSPPAGLPTPTPLSSLRGGCGGCDRSRGRGGS